MQIQVGTGLNDIYKVQQNQSNAQATNDTAKKQEVVASVSMSSSQTVNTEVGNEADEKSLQEHNLIKEIEKANKKLEKVDMGLEFSIHEQTKQIMIKVIDRAKDEVIREIPSEKILDIMASMCENAGLLVDEKI